MTLASVRWLKFSFLLLLLAAAAIGFDAAGKRGGPISGLPGLAPPPSPVAPARAASPPPLSRYQALDSGRMFGLLPAPPLLVSRPKVELPSLKGYRLIGLMAGAERFSWAVVEKVDAGLQEMVAVGDKLGPGKVTAIFANRIVVDLNGKRHQLVLADQARSMTDVLKIKGRSPAGDNSSRADGKSGLRLVPAGGPQGGWAVVSPGAFGLSLGIEPGDIILARDRIEIMRQLDGASGDGAVTLKISRRGRKLTIHYVPY